MAEQIILPSRINALLSQSNLYHGVTTTIKRFEPWLGGRSKALFFFPEFTDHGCDHITALLAGGEALVAKEVWDRGLLTPDDAGILVLASLLHDCAMHLTGDGFLTLMKAPAPVSPLNLLDRKSWQLLFDEFFVAARRWDDATIQSILGDSATKNSDTRDLHDHIKRPESLPDPQRWDTIHRKFFGEFVRRHHPRLAHEIAMQGVPSISVGRSLVVSEDLPSHICDLAGFIARSHGIGLRETFDYLKRRHGGRVLSRGTHPIFLMGLLRIADYLQMDATRVNSTLLQIERLRSPISQSEWDKHLATHTVQWPYEEDAHAVYVHAMPENARTFLDLRKLVIGLQRELDETWAVLGEVYSHQGELSQMGLTVRRVRCNLDDPAKFAADSGINYIPTLARFDSANPDLLKLLIRPLYGDKPEVGVRELLQNALDAVRERIVLLARGKKSQGEYNDSTSDPDVAIEVAHNRNGESWLIIRDTGIGMSLDVILNYFLRAGATYRRSEQWRCTFEDEGHSTVLRAGRFGVGALAAFLLGEELEVTTRPHSSSDGIGIRFTARLEDDVIDLRPVGNCAVGTTIRIRLSSSARSTFLADVALDSWDWYVLPRPSVTRKIITDGKEQQLKQAYSLPEEGAAVLPLGWGILHHPDFAAVHWTMRKDAPFLSCNGLIVNRRQERTDVNHVSPYTWGDHEHIPFAVPAISIFDPDGNLPLILQRNRLERDTFPFTDELLREVSKEFCAFLFALAPTSADDVSALAKQHPARERVLRLATGRASLEFPCIFGQTLSGAIFFHPWHIQRAGIQNVLWIPPEVDGAEARRFIRSGAEAIFWMTFRLWDDFEACVKLFEQLLPLRGEGALEPEFCSLVVPNRLTGSLDQVAHENYMADPAKAKAETNALRRHEVHALKYGWELRNSPGATSSARMGIANWWKQLKKAGGDQVFAAEWSFAKKNSLMHASPMTEVFEEYMEDAVIPFGRKARRSKFRKAYTELGARIRNWEEISREVFREVAFHRVRRSK